MTRKKLSDSMIIGPQYAYSSQWTTEDFVKGMEESLWEFQISYSQEGYIKRCGILCNYKIFKLPAPKLHCHLPPRWQSAYWKDFIPGSCEKIVTISRYEARNVFNKFLKLKDLWNSRGSAIELTLFYKFRWYNSSKQKFFFLILNTI